MPRTHTYEYVITRHAHARSGLWPADIALADMLRYDVATVTEELPDGRLRITSTRPPTIRRWESFGITVSDLTGGNR